VTKEGLWQMRVRDNCCVGVRETLDFDCSCTVRLRVGHSSGDPREGMEVSW